MTFMMETVQRFFFYTGDISSNTYILFVDGQSYLKKYIVEFLGKIIIHNTVAASATCMGETINS